MSNDYLKIINDFSKLNKHERKQEIIRLVKPYFPNVKIESNGNVENIVVPAEYNRDFITIAAHYDFYRGSRGINDNLSGCSVLLELIRTKALHNYNVEYVFFDKEESGCKGSIFYVSLRKPIYAITIDTCGCGDRLCCFSNYKESSSIIMPIIQTLKIPVSVCSFFPFGDHYSFINKNIDCLAIGAFFDGDLQFFNNGLENQSLVFKTIHHNESRKKLILKNNLIHSAYTLAIEYVKTKATICLHK